MTTPADLYRDCALSAWRVETLQQYTVPGDEERQHAFHAGEALPPPRQGKLDSLALISSLHGAGRTVGRIHVVDRPLSDYVRYELAVYTENVAAGEEIRIADRSLYPELGELDGDFAIFDAEAPSDAMAILFDYDDVGLIRGYRAVGDVETVDRCRDQLDLAYAYSVPLDEFLAHWRRES